MFLHALEPAEVHAFLGIAKHLIDADGRRDDAELRMLRFAEAETGVGAADVPSCAPSASVAQVVRTRRSRRAVLLELLGLAYADGEYHPHEREVIRAVSALFDVGDAELVKMEDWVQRQIALAAEANRFMSEEV
jgi:uncharacterized tellurite resistance protein B-like protein